ncbi:hypothetical protein BSNK01_01340 [Bacillaceae bacterium]
MERFAVEMEEMMHAGAWAAGKSIDCLHAPGCYGFQAVGVEARITRFNPLITP